MAVEQTLRQWPGGLDPAGGIVDSQAQLLDQVHDAVVTTDLNGIVQSWNAAATRIYGYSAEEMIGQHVQALYFPEDYSFLFEQTIGPMRVQTMHEIESRTRRKDGQEIFVALRLSLRRDANGTPIGLIGCSNDITARKQAEAALRDSEERFRLLAQGLKDCAIFQLDAQGNVVSWNGGAERIGGYRVEEIVGRHFSCFYPPEAEAQTQAQRHLEQALERGRVEVEGSRLRQDGSCFWAQMVITALFDETGHLRGYAIVTRDATELVDQRQRTLQSERLKVIGETIAAVSHEVRNELFAVQSGLQLLETVVKHHPKAMHWMQQLRSTQARLARLFEDMRNYAAPIVLQRRQSDLTTIWRQAWQVVQSRNPERGATLRETIESPELPHGLFDAFRLEQVFRNLFENSFAACGECVEVEIDCRRSPHDERAVRIVVRDHGPGMTAAQREKLFQPFFTTKATGTGLGLAISRRLLEAHQGTICAVESDTGAVFEILLPRDPA